MTSTSNRARTWRDRLWTSLLGLWDRLAYPFRYAENACVLWWWRGGFRQYWTRGDD